MKNQTANIGAKESNNENKIDDILANISNEIDVKRCDQSEKYVSFTDIIEIIDTVFIKTQLSEIPISVMKNKVAEIYSIIYADDKSKLAKLKASKSTNNLYRAIYQIANNTNCYKKYERSYNKNDVVCIKRVK